MNDARGGCAPPSGALAWVGLAALGVILVLHAFLLWIVWTFPADF